MVHRPSMLARPEVVKESFFLKMLQRLPPAVVAEIQKHFTWFECWKIYRVCRWTRDHFHPNRLPEALRYAGVLYAEQYYGRYNQPDTSDHSSTMTKRSNDVKKGPQWFACYHCYTIKGFEHFELYKWNIAAKEADHSDEDSTYPTSTPRLRQEYTPPPSAPTGNPHYDPTLTRSGLAAAARNGRRASTAHSSESYGKSDPPRVKETYGIRRYCVDCGLSKRIYRPGDSVDLHRPVGKGMESIWICGCWKIRWRSNDIKCLDCGVHVPLDRSNRRAS